MLKNGLFILSTLVVITLSLCLGLHAQQSNVIQAKLNNFKVVVDGLDVPAGPAIVYNGKNYLSVEDVAQAIGKPVKVDPVHKTIFIGKAPSHATVYLSDLTALNHQCTWGKAPEINKAESGPLSIAGTEFRKGVQLFAYIMRSSGKDEEVWIDFNLNQEYKHLTGRFGIDDALLKESRRNDVVADFFVIGDDVQLFSKENVRLGEIHDLDIDVTNVTKLRLMGRVSITSTEAPVHLDFVDLKASAD